MLVHSEMEDEHTCYTNVNATKFCPIFYLRVLSNLL